MTPNKRAGEIRIGSEKIGEFRADYNLDPKELEAIRVSLAREQESVIKAAHESQLGLRSMVFRDFRSVSEKHVKAHGKTMKEVQTKLSNIDNDGDYGPKTFEAVVHYQRNHGLKVDGIVGPETLKSLFSEGAHGDTGGTGTQGSTSPETNTPHQQPPVDQSGQETIPSSPKDINTHCQEHEVDFDTLPSFAQDVLFDIESQIGLSSVQGYKKFWKAIKKSDWSTAARELVDSGSSQPSKYLQKSGERGYINARVLLEQNADIAYDVSQEKLPSLRTEDTKKKSSEFFAHFLQKAKEKEELKSLRSKEPELFEMNAQQLSQRLTSTEYLKQKNSTHKVQQALQTLDTQEKKKQYMDELILLIGNFETQLDSGTQSGAYQQLVYLQDEDRFSQEVEYIDGEYGERTHASYMNDCYEKNQKQFTQLFETLDGEYDGDRAQAHSHAIQARLDTLTDLQKESLKFVLEMDVSDVSKDSDKKAIQKAQIYLTLQGEEITIDGHWGKEMEGYSLDHGGNIERAIKIIEKHLGFKYTKHKKRLSKMQRPYVLMLADFAKKFPQGSKYNSGSDRIMITCTIRTRLENKSIYGYDRGSRHLNGEAFDLRTNGKSQAAINAWSTFFRDAGLYVLRHTGTADHLHIGGDHGCTCKYHS